MFFFFNDTATTEIYTLSLHDALPIFGADEPERLLEEGGLDQERHAGERRDGCTTGDAALELGPGLLTGAHVLDRKSTRLNSSHANISYAVFCLKKKTTSHPR